MGPEAFTAFTLAHAAALAGVVAEKFAATVQSVAAPLQYFNVHPFGYVMSEAAVSLITAGSIVCTISCVTVPVPDTGISAMRLTLEPGATLDPDEYTADTDIAVEPTAAAGSTINWYCPAMMASAAASLTRVGFPRLRPTNQNYLATILPIRRYARREIFF